MYSRELDLLSQIDDRIMSINISKSITGKFLSWRQEVEFETLIQMRDLINKEKHCKDD